MIALFLIALSLLFLSWCIFYRAHTDDVDRRLRSARHQIMANAYLPSEQLRTLARALEKDFPAGEYELLQKMIGKVQNLEYAVHCADERSEKRQKEIQDLRKQLSSIVEETHA